MEVMANKGLKQLSILLWGYLYVLRASMVKIMALQGIRWLKKNDPLSDHHSFEITQKFASQS